MASHSTQPRHIPLSMFVWKVRRQNEERLPLHYYHYQVSSNYKEHEANAWNSTFPVCRKAPPWTEKNIIVKRQLCQEAPWGVIRMKLWTLGISVCTHLAEASCSKNHSLLDKKFPSGLQSVLGSKNPKKKENLRNSSSPLSGFRQGKLSEETWKLKENVFPSHFYRLCLCRLRLLAPAAFWRQVWTPLFIKFRLETELRQTGCKSEISTGSMSNTVSKAFEELGLSTMLWHNSA